MSIGDVAAEVMDALRVCLAAQLSDTGAGDTCVTGLVPGSLAVADWCTCTGGTRCGQGTVRLDRVYPYTQFPFPASGPAVACDSPLAAVIELGVYRCLPTSGPKGAPPDPAAQAQATLDQLADLAAIHAALTCCEAVTARAHSLGTYTPRDSGACGGGVWPITVALRRV